MKSKTRQSIMALTVKLKVYSEKHEEIERDERSLRRSYERALHEFEPDKQTYIWA